VEEVPAPGPEAYRVFELLGEYRLAAAQAEQELATLLERQRELRAQVEVARDAVAVLEKELGDNLAGWAALEEVDNWRRELVLRWDAWKVAYEQQLRSHYEEQLRRQHEQAEAWRLSLVALSSSWSTRLALAATWPVRAARRLLFRLRRRA
jgi:hypothetical protein